MMKQFVLLAFIASWATLIVWSVRTFWRTSSDARQARIYAHTKFQCVFVILFTAIFLPLALPIPDVPYWLKSAYWAVLTFPVILCIGNLCARVFFMIVDPIQKR